MIPKINRKLSTSSNIDFWLIFAIIHFNKLYHRDLDEIAEAFAKFAKSKNLVFESKNMEFTQQQIEKLRQAYFFLSEFKRMLENLSRKEAFVGHDIIGEYRSVVEDFRKFFPWVLTEFYEGAYLDTSFNFDRSGADRTINSVDYWLG